MGLYLFLHCILTKAGQIQPEPGHNFNQVSLNLFEPSPTRWVPLAMV